MSEHKNERPQIFDGSFQVEVLFETNSKSEAFEKEAVFVLKFDSTNQSKGYNLQSGGSKGFQTHKSTLKKMSRSHSGRKHSENTKKKISVGQIGLKRSIEFRDKMRKIRLDNPVVYDRKKRKDFSETIEKMAAARRGKPSWNKGKKMSNEQRETCKKAWEKRKLSCAT